MNLTSTYKDNSSERATADPAMTTTQATQWYLSYAPKSSRNQHCNSHFFDKLGFKPAHASEHMRTPFEVDIKTHLTSPSHMFLKRATNPEAFKIVVSEFLAEYGPIYWGYSKRDHLQEPDTLKGFLCPRDAQRVGSRLVEVVESFFNFRAQRTICADAKKSIANRANTHIDFAALTGRKADLIVYPGAIESSNFNKSNAAICESEDKEVDNGDLSNGSERMKSEESIQQTQTLDDKPTDTYGRTASREPLLPQWQVSSTRRPTCLTAPAKLNKDSNQAHLRAPAYSASAYAIDSSEKSKKRPRVTKSPKVPTVEPNSSPSSDSDGSSVTPPPKKFRHKQSTNSIVVCDDSSSDQEHRKREKPFRTRAVSKIKDKKLNTEVEAGVANVKSEPLTAGMIAGTIFLVTAEGSSIGPIRVPFVKCGNAELFFPRLIEEREIPEALRPNVRHITAMFTWSGEKFGIRKNNSDDWHWFCDALRQAWERHSTKVGDKCKVAIVLHVTRS